MRIQPATGFKSSVRAVMVGLAAAGLGLVGGIHASFASPEFLSPTHPTQLLAQSPKVISSGTFVSGEHPTKGGVKILKEGNKRLIQLDQGFSTFSMGPDLVVILHRANNVIGSTKPPAYALKAGDYVVVAPLQKFNGTQTYTIPENINLANYKSVGIWCRKFNATFGAATLK
ncbi:DM13 domain-containing protein [Synechococcus sp. PCC 6312]|uniref:DM13 domain-containing protein n=1 Tax=Synechococcus sp. (strain ATCC 27167 / PCC 6312) TaxID=195253 RepID=UPI00029EEC2C|nr:DM13 domain-containing protein [Synechococcus sp. PCC 6312]AFY61744.1 electron transfer protein with DM13 domain [Synechococcus sp. PCC 6312]